MITLGFKKWNHPLYTTQGLYFGLLLQWKKLQYRDIKVKNKQNNETVACILSSLSVKFCSMCNLDASFYIFKKIQIDSYYLRQRILVGEGNGNPLQDSCLENPMDGRAWWAAVHGVSKSQHDWANSLSLFTFMHWRRKWQPTPVFLPGESQGQGAWWAAIYGVAQSRTWLKWLSSSSSIGF